MVERLIDCTLRDGGYYNAWDFSEELVCAYLAAVKSVGVDVVELGFRSLLNAEFKGASAYTTDSYLESLPVPDGLLVAVMVNGAEFMNVEDQARVAEHLFPQNCVSSPVDIVRIACHFHECETVLPVATALKAKGYEVGFNIMQISERPEAEIENLAHKIAQYSIDVLYFADSLGNMTPEKTTQIVRCLRKGWGGAIGVHTHDNLGMALQNSLNAVKEGVSWVDATVAGMGRGPGNARTEELAIEVSMLRGEKINLIPLMGVLETFFLPLKQKYSWGTNPYYYLAGKYRIHPTYIQEMLADSRYSAEEILAVIEHLNEEGGQRFSVDVLDGARIFYSGKPSGKWSPREIISGRDVLILGPGPGASSHRRALERYIRAERPLVLCLNVHDVVEPNLVDLRIACHPLRLMADCGVHAKMPQPLVTPVSMLPNEVLAALQGKELLDFGIQFQQEQFEFHEHYCTIPSLLVFAYALAVATSGGANSVLLAGFDGYPEDDPRNGEMRLLLEQYLLADGSLELCSITPTRYPIMNKSVYGL